MSANKTWLSNLIFQLIEQFQILHDHHRKTFDEFPSIISAVNERCRRLSFASMFRRLFSSSFSTNFLTRFDSTLLECSRSLRRYFAGETLVAFFKSLPPGFALHSLIDLSLLFSFFFHSNSFPKLLALRELLRSWNRAFKRRFCSRSLPALYTTLQLLLLNLIDFILLRIIPWKFVPT